MFTTGVIHAAGLIKRQCQIPFKKIYVKLGHMEHNNLQSSGDV